MKICDLTQSYAATGGGVRTYLHAKRAHLRTIDDVGHVLIVPGGTDTARRREGSATYTVRSPRVPGSDAYRLLLRSDKVLRILAAEDPDVIEVQCAYTLPWTAMWHRRRVGGVVVGHFLTDVADAYVRPSVERLAGRGAGRAAGRIVERYTRAVYRRLDATIAPSPTMVARLGEIGVDDVVHLPLGVDLDVFHPARRDPALRRRFGVGPDDPLLIYVGRLDGERRPDLVADAFERLPSRLAAALVMIGEGPMRSALAERARRDARIHLLPFEADRGRLAAMLASADLYVSAMAHETFGLAVVEAQASGLPVVGVRSGAMVDRVVPGTGALVSPGSPEAMARCIASVAPGEWRRRGREARAHVERRFSWRRTFDRLLRLYERQVGGGRSDGRGAGRARRSRQSRIRGKGVFPSCHHPNILWCALS